jgi:hypothetical protein
MAKKVKNVKIYHPNWKRELVKLLETLYGEKSVEEIPPFGEQEVTRIRGWRSSQIENELYEERFQLKQGLRHGTYLVVFHYLRDKDGGSPVFYFEDLHPEYLLSNLLTQTLAKIPDEGDRELLVISNRGKQYRVAIGNSFYLDLDTLTALLKAKSGDKPLVYIDTKSEPWTAVKIEVEVKEEDDLDVDGVSELMGDS